MIQIELAGSTSYCARFLNMVAINRRAVALIIVIAFYFLVFEQQIEASRLQQLLLLQHLKKVRRKRMILLQIIQRNRRRARRAWTWPRNQFWFENLLHGAFVEDWWKENFRISRRTFEFIVRVAGPDMAKEDTRLRQSIPVQKRVAVALWRLATGDTYRSTGLQFGIGRCTAMLIKQDFCKAIAKRAQEFIKFPETEQEVLQSIRLFTNKSPFPQVVGAIDGCHIALKTVPVDERIDYFNRKQDYSVVIQGVADASFRFLDISAGYPGSIHDARVLRLSKLHMEIEQGNWLKGPTKHISGSEIGPLLVGDSAYPLSVWLMKPFKQTRTLSESQLRFNRALSQARVVIEQAYGILKGRWRCLYKALEEKTSRVPITILTCCVLHNICIDVGDPSAIDIMEDDDDDMDQSFNGDVSPIASDVRDNIIEYLSA